MAYIVVDIAPGRCICVSCQRAIEHPQGLESDQRRGHWHLECRPCEEGYHTTCEAGCHPHD